MPLPSERPISGRRLGPNTSSATMRITTRACDTDFSA
jgi:hypothetical protein